MSFSQLFAGCNVIRKLWNFYYRILVHSAGGVLNRYQLRRPDFPQNVLNKSFREYEYLSKVDAAGGFKKYEKAHLATLTKTFVPKFTMLPKELVRHVVSFWLHAGYY